MAVDKQYHCKLYIKVEGVIEVINVISDDPVEPGKRVEVMEYIDGSHRLLENEALRQHTRGKRPRVCCFF